MDQRFKSTMDLETAWDKDWKDTVAKKKKKKISQDSTASIVRPSAL